MGADDLHGERLRKLVEFAATYLQTGFPSPFGSSIYDEQTGELVAQAYDTVMQMCDPAAHAEMNAIRLAAQKLQRLSLRGCTLYSTCEPCPMCMSASIWAEIDAVVYGASTLEDTHLYWPQASDVSPQDLVSRMPFVPKMRLVPHVERPLCQALFRQCDDALKARGLDLPPNR